MKEKIFSPLATLFSIIVWVDAVDFFWRCVSGIATLLMLFFYYKGWKKKRVILDLEEQKLRSEIEALKK